MKRFIAGVCIGFATAYSLALEASVSQLLVIAIVGGAIYVLGDR